MKQSLTSHRRPFTTSHVNTYEHAGRCPQKERKTAREGTRNPLKETVREGTRVLKKETARVRTQRPWKTAAKVGTSVLVKYTARERTREPLKHQLKDGGFGKSRKKRSGRERRRKRGKSEALKKPLVDKAQRTLGELICVGKKRRKGVRKRQEEGQEFQGETISGKIWKMALLILMQNWFCVDAAAGRLKPKGKAEVPEIIIVSDTVEGTFVDLDGKSLREKQKEKHQRVVKRS